ncbi:VOC family protein [Streptomyces sp. NPDC005921]
MPSAQSHLPASERPSAAVRLDHTNIYATDRHRSAGFLAAVLGLRVGTPFGPFLPVDLGNGVTLDYYEKRDEPIQSQHYAFLVPEEGFDGMIARLEAAGVTYYADPRRPPAVHHSDRQHAHREDSWETDQRAQSRTYPPEV